PPARLDAFLDAVRWGAASTADVRSIQAPFRSGIEIQDYQLDPVARAVQMPRVSLLIADDVGLGKTIEAGLVALELIIRHRARKVLVVCPASLQIQWRDQMRDKFGLDFRIIDSELLRQLRRSRGLHVNPWTHFPRLITSIDFLKRERPLRLFREALPAEGEPAYPRRFDVLVVDEAHNVAPPGPGQYAPRSAPHRRGPPAGPALRAQAVPARHPPQRLPRELLGPPGAARRPAVRPRRDARPAAAGGRHGPTAQVRAAPAVGRLAAVPRAEAGGPGGPLPARRASHPRRPAAVRRVAAAGPRRPRRPDGDRVRPEASQEAAVLQPGRVRRHPGPARAVPPAGTQAAGRGPARPR